MPGLNGTGPLGEGRLTGRRMGRCTGAEPVGGGFSRFGGFAQGRGRRMAAGFGRGMGRRGFFGVQAVQATAEDELDYLKQQRESIEGRINELESSIDEKN